MKINSEDSMLALGAYLANRPSLPNVIELVGDVGAGKTTFTRGFAAALGITQPITSPSFTISKRYAFQQNGQAKTLVHYDFYRLSDPGIMRDELSETLGDSHSIVVIEWAGDVASLLPEQHLRLEILMNSDGSREIRSNHPHLLEGFQA